MAQISFVNGEFKAHDQAMVHIEDRGYQFADGVYEVCLVISGVYWDLEGHIARLQRSLDALRIISPMSETELRDTMAALIAKNDLEDALVYIQVTRGVASRNHAFPEPGTKASIVMTAKPFDLNGADAQAECGASVITCPDIRWGRVDIKTISLLPNVLAKQAAAEAGAMEAWLMRDGVITEGSSSNAWIVDADGALITHPKTTDILGGITRETTIACAEALQIKVIERPFTLAEAKAAHEAFITAATVLVMPVIAIDGAPVGDGTPGPIAKRLRAAYKDRARKVSQ